MFCSGSQLSLRVRTLLAVASVALVGFNMCAFGFDANGPKTPNSKEWPLVGGDLENTRYSTLNQINRSNVAKVRGAWISKPFDEGGTSRVTPVISGDLMFVTAGRYVYALNAKTGARVWKYETVRGGTATLGKYADLRGLPNTKGVAVGGGMVFVGLLDGRIIALSQTSGTLVWSRQTGSDKPVIGQWASPAPTYANGVLFAGLSNGDFSLRGRVTALDAATGKIIWQRLSVPDPGEKGHETWPAFNNTWRMGGGGVWTNSAVDPELSLVYFTTGNAVPPFAGDSRPGDNLFTCSVLAVDIRTGELRWYYQLVHHDIFEADIGTPVVLYDLNLRGVRRKALAVLRSDGYLFQLDRRTGEPILPVEERPVPQSESQKTSPTQPFPVDGDSILKSCDEWRRDRLPAGFSLGCMFTPPSFPPPSTDPPNVLAPYPSARASPLAYSPRTGYFYSRSYSWLRWARRAADPYYVEWSEKPPGLKGYSAIAAIDSRTGKIAWKKSIPDGTLKNGPLATAGGLVFWNSTDGNIEADNDESGEALWKYQTGMLGSNAPLATYIIGGDQYVAVSMGPAIWAFKLGGSIPPAPDPVASDPEEGPFSGAIVDTEVIETTSLGHSDVEPGNRYFIDEYAFNPYRARVALGSQVLFINNGNMRHEFVAVDGSWGTGPLDPTEQAWVTFTKPGNYVYICKDHPWSYGEIIVSAESASSESSGHGVQGDRSQGHDFAALARSGREQYAKNCSKCHGDNLAGHSPAPPIIGNAFMSHWENKSAAELLTRIQTTMPQGRPGSLDRDTYVSLVAYLLQMNNIAVGQGLGPEALEAVKLHRVSAGSQ